MSSKAKRVVIIGGGVSGLSCARHLHANGVKFTLLEAADRIGGRVQTDKKDGYLMDRGFQVLQTAYPEARRSLDYSRLNLRSFAPGAMVRIHRRFYTIADPLRKPKHLLQTLTAPIGTLADRFRLLRLVRQVTAVPLEMLFQQDEKPAMDFLKAEGFSRRMIQRFFVPFFGGVCLDPQIRASSRVLKYVLRMFAQGDAALPRDGMVQIPRQLIRGLPENSIRTGVQVRRVVEGRVVLDDGTRLPSPAIVLATDGPETRKLLGLPKTDGSISETCLYFAGNRTDRHGPFLMLNGVQTGLVNNVAIPSEVSEAYAPEGKLLISIVVLGNPEMDDTQLSRLVRSQLIEWFGSEAIGWKHLATYRIKHALPDQSPPTKDPTRMNPVVRPGIFACGEYGGLPGLQWSMVSGRKAAEAVKNHLADNTNSAVK